MIDNGTVIDTDASLDQADDLESRRAALSARWAAITFGAYVAVALPLLLFGLGRYAWFHMDEWSFLVRYTDGAAEVFQPHNEHWVTIPLLLYQALFRSVGLHSYLPYQAFVIVAHLLSAVLLRVVMRRAGVGPWLATLAAGTFVLFGAGERNIIGAFQITFTGALLFGLVHLVLADHDGPVDRRDWLGLAAGGLSLMFSGVGITMAVVVGVATLLRRGWRIALLHTVPLAAMYATWYLILRPRGFLNPQKRGMLPIAREIGEFVVAGFGHAFDAVGYLPWMGAVLGLLLVSGVALAWLPMSFDDFRRRAGMPVALLLGAVVFLASSGAARWWFPDADAGASRYLHIVAAMCLPAVAVAADAFVRRWRVAAPVVALVLAVGLVGNIGEFNTDGPRTTEFYDQEEAYFLTIPQSPIAALVPRETIPQPIRAPTLTVGWLLDADAEGRLPDPPTSDPTVEGDLQIRLGLVQEYGNLWTRCEEVEGPIDLEPAEGEAFVFRPAVVVTNRAWPADEQRPVTYLARRGTTLRVQAPGLRLRLAPSPPATSFTLCS